MTRADELAERCAAACAMVEAWARTQHPSLTNGVAYVEDKIPNVTVCAWAWLDDGVVRSHVEVLPFLIAVRWRAMSADLARRPGGAS